MTRKARFTQADIVRAVRGVHAAGLEVERVEIEIDGTITVVPRSSSVPRPPSFNPWDAELVPESIET